MAPDQRARAQRPIVPGKAGNRRFSALTRTQAMRATQLLLRRAAFSIPFQFIATFLKGVISHKKIQILGFS